MAFNKLEIFGGCDVNYILNENVELSESIISDLTQNAIHSPEWGVNTELLAIFNDSTNGGNLNNDNIISYRIQKRNIKENIMRTVANVDASDTKIIDFNIANNEVYKYYIVPIIEIDGVREYGRTVETPEISMDWDSWSVIGLRETESNIYEVDYDNIWIFKLNLEPGDYTVNIGKTFSDGIGRFPKSFTNSNNYVKGKLSCYMGDINCVSEYINDEICVLYGKNSVPFGARPDAICSALTDSLTK